MKWTGVAVIAAFSLTALRVMSAQTAVERGIKSYETNKCYRCHSIAGKGNAKGPLDGVGAKLSTDEIRKWIVAPAEMTATTKAKRKPVMREYPNLPKEEVDDLVAYMVSLKTK